MEQLDDAAWQTSNATWRSAIAPEASSLMEVTISGSCHGASEAQTSIAVMEAPLDVSEVNHRCLYVCADTISDVNISEVNVSDANISEVNVSEANISEVNVSDANISEVNVSDANISEVNVSDVFSEASVSDLTISDFNTSAATEDSGDPDLRASPKCPLKSTCSNPAAVTRNVEECLAHFSGRRCHLCRRKKSFDLPQSLLLHAQKFHLQKALRVGGYILLRCHLFCGPRSAHYHCPLCAYTSCGMTDVKKHALAHGTLRNTCVPSSRNAWSEVAANSGFLLTEGGSSHSSGAAFNGESLKLEVPLESSENDSSLQLSNSASKKPNSHSLCNNRGSCSERILRERNSSSLLETHLASNMLIKEIKEEPPPFDADENVDAAEPTALVDCIAVKLEEEEWEAASDVCLNVCDSEQTPRNWRLSLPSSLQEAFDKLALDTCYLCAQRIKFESKTLLEVHFFRHHVRQSIPYTGDCVGLVCNLGCCGLSRHSHCPRCSFLAEDLLEVRSHYSEYHSRDEKSGSTNDLLCRGYKSKILVGISGLESPPLLQELLMLEVDAVPSVITGFLCDKARESVVLDATALHDKIKSPHCLLCDDGREYSNPRLLFVHFQRCHVKRANVSCVLPSLMCRLSCKGFGRGHYHCPLCDFVIHDLTKLKVHQQKIHRDALQCARTELAAGRTISPEALTAAQRKGASAALGKVCRGGLVRGKARSQSEQDGEEDNEEGSSASLPVSVVKDIAAARSRLSLPDCYLCRSERDFFTKKRLLDHFERSHVKRAIDYPPYSILSCHLNNDKYRDRGHFHCPWCWFSSHDRHIVYAHLENHSSKMELAKRNVSALRAHQIALSRDDLSDSADAGLPPAAQALPRLEKEEIRWWQQQFHEYLKRCVLGRPRHRQHVMRRRTRQAIVHHLVHGTPLASSHVSEAALRTFKVTDIPRLGLRKCLVERVPALQRDSREMASPCLLRRADGALVLPSRSPRRAHPTSAGAPDPSTQGCRRVACVEEFFSILHRLHVAPSGAHVPACQMMWQLQRKYTHIPRSVARKFLDFCPKCCSAARSSVLNYSEPPQPGRRGGRNNLVTPETAREAGAVRVDAPIRRVTVQMFDGPRPDQEQKFINDALPKGDRVELQQTSLCSTSHASHLLDGSSRAAADGISCSSRLPTGRFMDRMLVNVIDMRDYPDGGHQYIVHCQDAHTQLHFLLALRQLRTREIAFAIISKVVSVTGLPALIVSSSGSEFVESLVAQIALLWTGSCSSLLTNCTSQRASTLPTEGSMSDSSDVVRELTVRILSAVGAGRPVLWTSWLPHVQYTLNTETKLPQLTPFQVVFRKSVCPPVGKPEVSTLFTSELISPGIISHQYPSPQPLGRRESGSKDMNSTAIEILDVTAGGFLVDDGMLSHVEVVLPENSHSNTPDLDADFSMSSADLLGEGRENAVSVMHPFSHFSTGATGDELAVPNTLSANVSNLDTVKGVVPVDDVFDVGNAIAVEEAITNRNTIGIGDAMTVDSFMAVENTVTVESVTDELSDSTSIFSSAQNARVEIFPTLEAVVEDADNYFC